MKKSFWFISIVIILLFLLLGCNVKELSRMPYIPEAISDHSGGVIVCWQDKGALYAKRLNKEGKTLWPEEKRVISENINPFSYRMIPDGEGNAIIVWIKGGTEGEIYAQKINKDGSVLWGRNGTPVCVFSGARVIMDLVKTGIDRTFILWWSQSNGSQEISGQLINNAGEILWQDSGVILAKGVSLQSPVAAPDSSGGVITAWVDQRGIDADIYAQRVDATGRILWQKGGIPVCTASGLQDLPQIVSDGQGGVFISWWNYDGDPPTIVAQRINQDGKILWPENGITIAPNDNPFKMINIGQGEAILTSIVGAKPASAFPDQWTLYIQKLNGEGQFRWKQEPVFFSSAVDRSIAYPEISFDSRGAIFIACNLGANPAHGTEVRIQKLDGEGNYLWERGGINPFPTSVFQAQWYPKIVADGSGGVIVVATVGRGRNDRDLVYAQRIDSLGNRLWGEEGVIIGYSKP